MGEGDPPRPGARGFVLDPDEDPTADQAVQDQESEVIVGRVCRRPASGAPVQAKRRRPQALPALRREHAAEVGIALQEVHPASVCVRSPLGRDLARHVEPLPDAERRKTASHTSHAITHGRMDVRYRTFASPSGTGTPGWLVAGAQHACRPRRSGGSSAGTVATGPQTQLRMPCERGQDVPSPSDTGGSRPAAPGRPRPARAARPRGRRRARGACG